MLYNSPILSKNKKLVDIDTWMWNPKVDVSVLFHKMKYLRDEFVFVKKYPKYIFYCKKNQHTQIPNGCKRIFLTSENILPDMKTCDWAFGFAPEDKISNKRYLRFPNFVRLGAGKDLIKSKNYSPNNILKRKKRFCAFVYSNGNVKFRNLFFKQLSRYKKVDAPGKVFNNMPMIGGFKNTTSLDRHLKYDFYKKYDLKINFLKDYKFVICFENSSALGYTTEKIYHTMLANCIPIYWGNKDVGKDFNTNSFLNFDGCGSISALIDQVIELDKDDTKYLNVLKQSWLPNNRISQCMDTKRILKRFRQIFL